MTEKEIWKTYPEIPFIEASNLGNVRTVDHWVTYKNGVRRLVKGHVLKQNPDRYGYMLVQCNVNGKKINLLVHQVIAKSFIPNPLGLSEINHKDNNPKNNTVNNLEWCTHKYNMVYRENINGFPP